MVCCYIAGFSVLGRLDQPAEAETGRGHGLALEAEKDMT